MQKKTVLAGILGILILGGSVLVGGFSLGFKPSYIDPANQKLVAKGKEVYEANCASCHGLNLQGEANWQLRKTNGRVWTPPLLQALCLIEAKVRLPTCIRSHE